MQKSLKPSKNQQAMDEAFMKRCIQLAKNGLGTTAPNPMVGCVIVKDYQVIGEGFTSPYGGPHAEVNAINSVKEEAALREAILYVTLEPCSHYGKTPPCADLIIEKGIPEVVIGVQDPHDKVAGAGIKKLEAAGCKVRVGILEEACRQHHKRFLSFHEKKRPFLVLKWAQSSDGFIAPKPDQRAATPEPFWITNPFSRQLVHKWRTEEQAILVGTRTVLEDNPKLTARKWHGGSPIRIVIDRNLRIPEDFAVFDKSAPTMVLTEQNRSEDLILNVQYEQVDFSKNPASHIAKKLYSLGIQSVLIEGGAKTLQTFIEEGLWDEARVFTGNIAFGSGLKAPVIKGMLAETIDLKEDQLNIWKHD